MASLRSKCAALAAAGGACACCVCLHCVCIWCVYALCVCVRVARCTASVCVCVSVCVCIVYTLYVCHVYIHFVYPNLRTYAQTCLQPSTIMHTHMYAHIYARTHEHAHVDYTHTNENKYVDVCRHVCMYTECCACVIAISYTCGHAHIRTLHTHVPTFAHFLHTCTLMYSRIYTHTHQQTHVYDIDIYMSHALHSGATHAHVYTHLHIHICVESVVHA